MYLSYLESSKVYPSSYTEQIDTLDNIQESIQALSVFLSDQKKSLEEKQNIIQRMDEERKQMEPILSANREQVDAIIQATNVYERRNKWIERGIGFFSGLFSSFIVALLFNIYLNKHKKNTQPKGS